MVVADGTTNIGNSPYYWPRWKLGRILGSVRRSRVDCRVTKCELRHTFEALRRHADSGCLKRLENERYAFLISGLWAFYVKPGRLRPQP